MLTPASWKDWTALLIICLLGVGALFWLLPWSVHHPFVVPLEHYAHMDVVRKRLSEVDLMNLTPVVVGIAVVTGCASLYCAWMSYSMSRPIALQSPPGHHGDQT